MTALFNHTSIASTGPAEMAAVCRDLLEADEALRGAPSAPCRSPSVCRSSSPRPIDVRPQHDAYLPDDEHFDRAYALITRQDREHWADPQRTEPGEINHGHGGRGVYLLDPSGHYLELITRPYL